MLGREQGGDLLLRKGQPFRSSDAIPLDHEPSTPGLNFGSTSGSTTGSIITKSQIGQPGVRWIHGSIPGPILGFLNEAGPPAAHPPCLKPSRIYRSLPAPQPHLKWAQRILRGDNVTAAAAACCLRCRRRRRIGPLGGHLPFQHPHPREHTTVHRVQLLHHALRAVHKLLRIGELSRWRVTVYVLGGQGKRAAPGPHERGIATCSQ